MRERLNKLFGSNKEPESVKQAEGVAVAFFDALPSVGPAVANEVEAKRISLAVGQRTNIGQVRDHNEDNVDTKTIEDWLLLQAADGMGGYLAGEIASELAIKSVPEKLAQLVAESGQLGQKSMQQAIRYADKQMTGDMGTTYSGVLINRKTGEAILGNVGDSRTYLLRAGKLFVTFDQTFVAHKVFGESGHIDDIKDEDGKNVLANALGGTYGMQSDAETHQIETTKGDVFLLCSDGLWEITDTQDILDAMQAVNLGEDPQETCDSLVDLANKNGGADNISVIIARVDAPEDKPEEEPPAAVAENKAEDNPTIETERLEPHKPKRYDLEDGEIKIILGNPDKPWKTVLRVVNLKKHPDLKKDPPDYIEFMLIQERVFQKGDDKPGFIELSPKDKGIFIGRNWWSNEVLSLNNLVSRDHLFVQLIKDKDDRFYLQLTDLKSKNGTYVQIQKPVELNRPV